MTLIFDAVTNTSGANSIDVRTMYDGLLGGWVNIAAAGTEIDSFGLSSLDDDGTGDRGINFSPAQVNSTFCIDTGPEDGGAVTSCVYADVTNGTWTTQGFDGENVFTASSTDRTNSDKRHSYIWLGELA
jgi:hypothetical protein